MQREDQSQNIQEEDLCPSECVFLCDHRQVFSYTANKEIRTDDLCLDVSRLNGPVMMLKCHHLKGNQLWEYDPVVSRTLTLTHTNTHTVSSFTLFLELQGSRLFICHYKKRKEIALEVNTKNKTPKTIIKRSQKSHSNTQTGIKCNLSC